MRQAPFLQGLLELPTIRDPANRRAAWRAAVANLARACTEDMPSPLEGIAPSALVASVRAAIASGFVDDLDWLSDASSGMALHEIGAALPAGTNEKREIGRRVLSRLLEGRGESFVALATRMAKSGALKGEAIRARLALVLSAPASYGLRVDALALAIASRRELARQWIDASARGSLPDRRLAGMLLEQAARAIVRAVAAGDDRPLRVLRSEAVAQAHARLFDDREPLVWRHVAVARGLLAAYDPSLRTAIESSFSSNLTPTEWRRGATSLTAHAGVRPDWALRKLREVLAKGLLTRDPGAVAPLLWGLPAAAETEPEIAEAMLDVLVDAASPGVAAEAMREVVAQGPGGAWGKKALGVMRGKLARSPPAENDDGAAALRARLLVELGDEERDPSVVDLVDRAVRSYVEEGARSAFRMALEALGAATGSVDTLEALSEDAPGDQARAMARRAVFTAVRDVDAALFENGLLRELLLLGGRAPEAQRALETIESLHERTAGWLLQRERAAPSSASGVGHPSLRLRQLRMLLHVADAGEGEGTSVASAGRCARIANATLGLLVAGPPPIRWRTISATFARAVDAVIRNDVCDPADALLVVASRGLGTRDLDTLAEASMNEDWRALLRAFSALLVAVERADAPATSTDAFSSTPSSFSSDPGSRGVSSLPPMPEGSPARAIEALFEFARALDADASTRIEAMRGAVLRLARSLARLSAATSLAEAAGIGGGASAAADADLAVTQLAQLTAGARQRLGDPTQTDVAFASENGIAKAIDLAVESGQEGVLASGLAAAKAHVARVIPPVFANVVAAALDRLYVLPVSTVQVQRAAADPEPPLPAWLPRRRTLGGFYVLRVLGSGTGGTVFVARRIEDKNDPDAERFALKVPDYDGNAARTLTEEQFMALFREEAVALLGMPHHPSLARFVTFDLAARPKPILVMELVEGMSLDRLVASGGLETPRAFDILDGILAGLGAMHASSIGHLDVKPSNVILRGGNEPVLVDFGLAGRHIRPGCGTLQYGAPEVWGIAPEGHSPGPMPVDVYAFACLAFEVLTSHPLFEGSTEIELIAAHVAHDGWPERLRELSASAALRPLAELLSLALRRDPRRRIDILEVRSGMKRVGKSLASARWPLVARRALTLLGRDRTRFRRRRRAVLPRRRGNLSREARRTERRRERRVACERRTPSSSRLAARRSTSPARGPRAPAAVPSAPRSTRLRRSANLRRVRE